MPTRPIRIALVLLAAAFSAPAVAGDVDAHFDRNRGRPTSSRSAEARSEADGDARVVPAARERAEVEVRKDQTVTLVVTPKGDATCTVEVRAR